MIRIILELLGLYLLYKLIFDFIIPVYQTTKQVKGKVNEMNDRLRQFQQQQQTTVKTQPSGKTTATKEDYIEFEDLRQ